MTKRNFIIHSAEEILRIRAAAQAAADIRDKLAGLIRHGMSTKDIDELAATLMRSLACESAFLGYRGFPGQTCISVNDEVVHGIGRPDKIVRNGDIVSIDIGVKLGGAIGDTARTVAVGDCAPEALRLMRATEAALAAGIKAATAGNNIRHISSAVEAVANAEKLGVVREYVGHGCGIALHEPPEVPNFKGADKGPELRPGMVLAIEPMFNLGTHKVKTDKDRWTVRTSDARLSAHFEHMVLITDNEPEVLTWPRM